MTGQDFEGALARFLERAQGQIDQHYRRDYPRSVVPCLEVMPGSRYRRVVAVERVEGSPVPLSRSAWAFVEVATGNVLKPDGWKRPAKHARGSIYAEDPFKGCTVYGPESIR